MIASCSSVSRDGSIRMRSGSWNSSFSSSLCGSAKMSGMSSRSDRAGLHADRARPAPAGAPLRRLGRQLGGDPAADRTADHVDLIEAQPVEQFEIDVGDVVHRIDPVGQAGFAEARMRRRDQPMPRRQQAHIGMLGHEAAARRAGTGSVGPPHPRTRRVPRRQACARDTLPGSSRQARCDRDRGHAARPPAPSRAAHAPDDR